jgi:hypothetical protein
MTTTVTPQTNRRNAPTATLSLPDSATHLIYATWTEHRTPRASGDYRARAYRVRTPFSDAASLVVTLELVTGRMDGFENVDVLDIAYPQDTDDLRGELDYYATQAAQLAFSAAEDLSVRADAAIASEPRQYDAQPAGLTEGLARIADSIAADLDGAVISIPQPTADDIAADEALNAALNAQTSTPHTVRIMTPRDPRSEAQITTHPNMAQARAHARSEAILALERYTDRMRGSGRAAFCNMPAVPAGVAVLTERADRAGYVISAVQSDYPHVTLWSAFIA